MLDLMNYERSRGILVLNAKEVRDLERNLFDYTVGNLNIKIYAEMCMEHIDKMLGNEDMPENNISDLKIMKLDIEQIIRNIMELTAKIEKARDVLR